MDSQERESISDILQEYKLNRNVFYLAQALKTTCDNESFFVIVPLLKEVIFTIFCQCNY